MIMMSTRGGSLRKSFSIKILVLLFNYIFFSPSTEAAPATANSHVHSASLFITDYGSFGDCSQVLAHKQSRPYSRAKAEINQIMRKVSARNIPFIQTSDSLLINLLK